MSTKLDYLFETIELNLEFIQDLKESTDITDYLEIDESYQRIIEKYQAIVELIQGE